MYSDVSGYVGIGTTNPVAELHLGGTYTSLQMGSSTTPSENFHFVGQKTGDSPNFGLYNGNLGTGNLLWMVMTNGNMGLAVWNPIAQLQLGGTYTSLQMGSSTTPSENFHFVGQKTGASPNFGLYNGNLGTGNLLWTVMANGRMGLGVPNPIAELQLGGTYTSLQMGSSTTPTDNFHFVSQKVGTGPEFILCNGNLGSGTPLLTMRASGNHNIEGSVGVRGNIAILSKQTGDVVMTLGEGLDYAEGFNVTKTETEEAGPGTVLVIDPANAGKLTVSTRAYDTKVAGIVAGAKSLGSGVRLGTGQFDQDVALAGRVYCNVDATETAVRPGDLLTTSTTPGYAMKASDPSRAYGTILGKAMENLEQGKKGQILVLVTLQ